LEDLAGVEGRWSVWSSAWTSTVILAGVDRRWSSVGVLAGVDRTWSSVVFLATAMTSNAKTSKCGLLWCSWLELMEGDLLGWS